MELITGENDKGRRLDRVLRKVLPDYPLPLLHRLLRQGRVFVNGKPAQAQYRLDSGEIIGIPFLKENPTHKSRQKNLSDTFYQKKPSLDILWQGAGLLAINKPPGLVVHGTNSLDVMVREYLDRKLPHSLSFKPGPLHRLDKPSSGIVIFTTNIEGSRLFSKLMRERKIKKFYLALVEGKVLYEEIWEDDLFRDTERRITLVSGSEASLVSKDKTTRNAITKVIPVAANNSYSLILAEIITGRTHQIRAQAASRGYPLAGDWKYNTNQSRIAKYKNIFLHAWRLSFLNYSIEAPIPETFRKEVNTIFKSGVSSL
jgi:23S rRNA pseudouridine955/2504/2580 synthase